DVRDGDDGGAAGDGEDAAPTVRRARLRGGEDVGGGAVERGAGRLLLELRERRPGRGEFLLQPIDLLLRGRRVGAGLRRVALGVEPVREERRRLGLPIE